MLFKLNCVLNKTKFSIVNRPVVASSAVQLIAIATDALRGVLDSAFATAAANTLLSVYFQNFSIFNFVKTIVV